MATHSLTIELSDIAFRTLQDKVSSGRYASVNNVIEDALMDWDLPVEALPPANGRSYDEWMRDEAIAAYDEHLANPGDVYNSQQVLTYLAEQRTSDPDAR